MKFIDLGKQYQRIKENVNKRICSILDSNTYIMGKEITELEKELADYVGRKHCLSCSSGTSALIIPLMAYNLKENDAVFVSSFTFFASAEAIVLAGATPVFIDSDETYNLNPEKLEEAIEAALQEGKLIPKGIMPVDIFGLVADYETIEKIAKKYDLFVISDAAQSFGGERDGKKACSFGDVAGTSFFPAKPLGCYGDGGAIFTDNDELYEVMKSIRIHGQGESKYDNVRIGINGRLDTIQAAVLLEKLKILDDERRVKLKIATQYSELLKDYYEVPIIPDNCESALAQYTILTKDSSHREQIIQHMESIGIPIMIYYVYPMHMQKAFEYLNYKPSDLHVSENFSKRAISLPMHAYLTSDDVNLICEELVKLAK
ncbi:MAG: DegT/DnrJ/EryC1/StrS family aminotransferase [Clostridiaceae bacterium]|nr:DegT/DnrJ/EryC1/StrS family aminotransferase [Clostridiaceae bacterium]